MCHLKYVFKYAQGKGYTSRSSIKIPSIRPSRSGLVRSITLTVTDGFNIIGTVIRHYE